MIKSVASRLRPQPALAATGYCLAFSKRESMNVPWPYICVFATYAFQYVTVPHPPVQVCWFTPASPNADGIIVAALLPSGLFAFPSIFSSASYRPGPQLFRTVFTVSTSTPSRSLNGLRFGAVATIAPTFRSRLPQPSRRLPIPGANESSTVE